MKTRRSVQSLALLVMAVLLAVLGTVASSVLAADSEQKMELKFATLYPPMDQMCIGPQYIFKQLDVKTGGRVKVQEYYSQSLGKAPEMLTLLDKGIADFVLIPPVIFPNVFVMTDALSLPNLISDMRTATKSVYEMEAKGILAKDLAGYKIVLWEGTDPMYLAFRNKKVTNLADLQKMKIRAPAGTATEIIEALGAKVVTIPTADIYTAMERGTVDGLITSPGLFFSSKLSEVAKFVLWNPFGAGANLLIMKQSRWDSLPGDIRNMLSDLSKEAVNVYYEEAEKRVPDNKAQFAKLGVQVYTLDKAEDDRWDVLLNHYIDKWVTERESKKYPAKEAVKIIRESARKSGK